MAVRNSIRRASYDATREVLSTGELPWSVPGVRGGAARFLLDYSTATFTRTSEAAAVDPREGWAFYDLTTPWPGIDVPRILPDGAILIEGARTNQVINSADLTDPLWTQGGSPDPTLADATGAPDGSAIYSVEDDNPSGFDTLYDDIGTAVGGATEYSFSWYVPKDAITDAEPGISILDVGIFRVSIDTSSGTGYVVAGAGSVAVSDAGDFWRIEATHTPNAGTPEVRLYPALADNGVLDNSLTRVADYWNIQYQEGPTTTSPVRTSGAAAAAAADEATIATADIGAGFLDGSWSIEVTLIDGSADAPATQYIYYLDASNYLAIINGTTVRLRAGGVNYDVAGLSYSALTTLAIAVDFPGGSLTVTGGGGGSASPANDWSGSAADLDVGWDGTGDYINGVITRPEAA